MGENNLAATSDKVNFADAARIAQALKFQIRSGNFWDDLPPASKESLDQIATSIARIVVGDGAHWDAIIGFAQAAKPEKDPMRSQVEGMRAIERAVREIPARNDHG